MEQNGILLNNHRTSSIAKHHDLDGLIASSGVNVLYSTNFQSDGYACFPYLNCFTVWSEGGVQPVLIIPKGYLFEAVDDQPRAFDIRTYGKTTISLHQAPDKLDRMERELQKLILEHNDNNLDPVEILVDVIKEKGLHKSRLGLDERGISPIIYENIQKTLPQAVIIPASQLWRQIRAVKTPAEVQRLRDAAWVNERALSYVYEAICAGAVAGDLLNIYLQRLPEYGGRFAYWDTGIGTESSSSFPSSAYTARPGDLVRVDAACTRDYYYSDTGRTLILGEPNAKQTQYLKAIRAGIQKGLELIKPGVLASTVFEGMMKTVKEEGIPHHKRYGCGHGIGLEFYDLPLINPIGVGNEDTLLEEGMVINLETPYYELGFGGIQIEDTVVVTHDGCERLTRHSMDLITR